MKRIAINGFGRIGRLAFRLIAEENDMEWGGSDYYVPGGNTITVPEDVMKTLPVNKELKMYVTYCFDYERKIWGIHNDFRQNKLQSKGYFQR